MKNKKNFVSWYYNFIDFTKNHFIELTVNVYREHDRQDACILIESSDGSLNKKIDFTSKEIHASDHHLVIGQNKFTKHEVHLDISCEDYVLKGVLELSTHKETKQSKWRPGIMGPFHFFPFLNSYHDVISLSHTVSGTLEFNNEVLDFTGGKGYLEKEWGSAYPRAWIWAQCNHFEEQQDLSVMLGVARVPFLFNYYTSFSVPVYYKGQLEVFTGYNGGQIAKLYRNKGYVHLVITQKSKVLDLKVFGDEDVEFTALRSSQMAVGESHRIRDVYASHHVKMEIKIMQDNHIILEDKGYYCQLEMGGNTSKLK